MMLTAPLLSKSSFLSSLLNKIRQVPKIKMIKSADKTKTLNNNLTPTVSTTSMSPVTLAPSDDTNLNASTGLDITNGRPAPMTVAHISSSSSSLAPPKTLEEQIGLPPRPKKPLTPYFRFMQQQRPKTQAENPSVKNLEIVRLISKQWEIADPALKQRLQEEYKREQEQYVERRTKYDSKVTDDQRAELKQMKQDLAEAKERRLLRKRVKELGRPKKPMSAFLRFVAKERVVTPQSAKQTYREWHQKATARWTRLSDADKEVFLKEARIELEKYKKEISAWEEKMIRLGHIDVVRQGNLIDPSETKPKKH